MTPSRSGAGADDIVAELHNLAALIEDGDKPWPKWSDQVRAAATEIERLRDALRESIRPHVECLDGWYSCPKSPDGCLDHEAGPDCTCGADKWNAKVSELLRARVAELGEGK